MQIINKDFIKSLGPCESGYKNYLSHYNDFNGTLVEFLLLNNIPYNDKTWLVKKLINKKQAVRWAIYCVESVLPLWKDRNPEDNRVEACILATRAYEINPSQENLEILREAKQGACAADYAASAAYAAYAASVASAAYAASAASAASAADAAATASAASAASVASAAYAAYAADADAQRDLNIKLLIKAIQEVG